MVKLNDLTFNQIDAALHWLGDTEPKFTEDKIWWPNTNAASVIATIDDLLATEPELQGRGGHRAALQSLRRELVKIERWVVKPWSADGDPAPTANTADGWFVQDSRLGYATEPFPTREAAEAEANRRNKDNLTLSNVDERGGSYSATVIADGELIGHVQRKRGETEFQGYLHGQYVASGATADTAMALVVAADNTPTLKGTFMPENYPFVRLHHRNTWMEDADIQHLVDLASSDGAPQTATHRIGEVGWHTIEDERDVARLESWLTILTEQGDEQSAATLRDRLARMHAKPTT